MKTFKTCESRLDKSFKFMI